MSLPGRLRVGREPFIGRARKEDEALAEFGTRRLGKEAFQALIDPMASGVFAGDPEHMSLKSCFPRINEIETKYGSLIGGMLCLQIKARREGSGKEPGPGPGGHLTSFANGMSEMTDRLSSGLGARIKTSSGVKSIDHHGGRYQLQLESGQVVECDALILAAPAHAQSQMLQQMSPQLSGLLGGIDYPPLSVVCLGYREADLQRHPEGFGFLIPSGENRSILGTIVDSNVFPARAPDGSVLLRTMVGGARAPDKARLSDQEMADMVRTELRDIMAIKAEPEFLRIYRHERAIPQYHVGHGGRLLAIELALKAHPGLVLTGNAFKGVSLNDCVSNAGLIAQSVLDY